MGSSILGFLYDTIVILYPVAVAIIGMILKLLLNGMIKPIQKPADMVAQDENINRLEA